jgi:hypothetical protein
MSAAKAAKASPNPPARAALANEPSQGSSPGARGQLDRLSMRPASAIVAFRARPDVTLNCRVEPMVTPQR